MESEVTLRFGLLALVACGSEPLPALDDLDLGAVPVGARLELRVPLPDDGAVESEGLDASVDGDTLALAWTPAALDETARATVTLEDGRSFEVRAVARAWPVGLADPPLVSQGYERLDSVAATGLGDAALDGDAPAPFALDPVTGNAFFGDAERGRAWRIDPFYNHPSWGLWVPRARSQAGDWTEPPGCFLSDDGLYQDGSCTGDERDADGGLPDGWRYLHGGFAGDGELVGLTALAPDPARGRIWALGDRWLMGIDTALATSEDEGGDPYTYLQVVPELRLTLRGPWGAPWAAVAGDRLWLVDRETAAVGWLALPLGEERRPQIALRGGWSQGARGALSQTQVFAATAQGVVALDAATGALAWSATQRGLTGAPIGSATLDDRAVFVWPEALVLAEDGRIVQVPAPDGARFVGAAFDRVSGGEAETQELLVAALDTGAGGELALLSPEGAWLDLSVALAAPPSALGYGADAHDLYVLYAAGAEGCDGALAATCDEVGQRPAVVETLYNPYSLVPPTSAGHPLNLFLAPVVETPQDTQLDDDFSGQCPPGEELEVACCALRWAALERLGPNADYLQATVGAVGADTETLDDDPTLVWGLNPSALRLALTCLEDPEQADAGEALIEALGLLAGPRAELAHLTHLGLDSPEEHLDWYLSLLYTAEVDYSLPIDDQDEYQRLHDGLSAVFAPALLGEGAPDLSATLGAGNAFDAETLVARGWEGGSWVAAIRDGPLAVGQPARRAFYFLSAGADPEIGTQTGRKKELWPLDLRQRVAVTGLSEDPAAPSEDVPGSGLLNLPGNTWAFGAIATTSEAGAFRESFKAEGDIDDETWAFTLRYLRRVLASSSPEQVKVWSQHIIDVTSAEGLLTEHVVVGEQGDPNVAGLSALNELLVVPGYARWALPSEVIAEHAAAEAR